MVPGSLPLPPLVDLEGRVDAQLTGTGGEDQPVRGIVAAGSGAADPGIAPGALRDEGPAQDVFQERSRRRGVVGVDQRVDRRDHVDTLAVSRGGGRSARYRSRS